MDKYGLEKVLKEQPFMSLNDAVFKLIFDEVVSLKLSPGFHLVEKEISEQLNISRTPVNFALKKLCAENLVTKEKNKYIVAPLKREECRILYESRIGIEGYAAYLSVRRITPRQIRELGDAAAKYAQAVKSAPMEQGYYDDKFHNIIIQAANNPHIATMYQTTVSQMLRYRNYISKIALNGELRNILSQAVKDHRTIINAIKLGFSDLARSEMEHHIETMYDVFLDWDYWVQKIKESSLGKKMD